MPIDPNVKAVEVPSEPISAEEMERIHPSLRHLYEGGVVRTYDVGGTRVRILGAYLPKTQEENQRRLREAWRVADDIARRAGERAYQKMLAEQAGKEVST